MTTDHGTINDDPASKLVGERNLNSNLRYKVGRAVSRKGCSGSPRPSALHLPVQSRSQFMSARDDAFAYPNRYNHYVQYYRNTFQHGGISPKKYSPSDESVPLYIC